MEAAECSAIIEIAEQLERMMMLIRLPDRARDSARAARAGITDAARALAPVGRIRFTGSVMGAVTERAAQFDL